MIRNALGAMGAAYDQQAQGAYGDQRQMANAQQHAQLSAFGYADRMRAFYGVPPKAKEVIREVEFQVIRTEHERVPSLCHLNGHWI